jgi:hypothetical protein
MAKGVSRYNLRYCKIIDGPFNGLFIDVDHWAASRLLSQSIRDSLDDLSGVYFGKFKKEQWLGGYFPYYRTYYTAIPINPPNSVLDGVTLGILMDYNSGLEEIEGIDPTCRIDNGAIFSHLCSSFSNEDLPSAYLGFVAYKNNWNLKNILGKLVSNVEEDTEGTNQFPKSIIERLLDAQNHCFTPRLLDQSTGQFTNIPWPPDIVYEAIGPGEYWSRSSSGFVKLIPTPPSPGPTPAP